MIRGIHGLFYSSDPEATRALFRDQVRLPGSDVGDGWWIFDVAEGDQEASLDCILRVESPKSS
jgi:hypothetical protein